MSYHAITKTCPQKSEQLIESSLNLTVVQKLPKIIIINLFILNDEEEPECCSKVVYKNLISFGLNAGSTDMEFIFDFILCSFFC